MTDIPLGLQLAEELQSTYDQIDVFQSPKGSLSDLRRFDARDWRIELTRTHDLIVSLHCKQLFPADLVRNVRCINVHPGFNPFNRGWYPQVFSIANGMKAGVTIHEMDEHIDHGPIIVQKEYKIRPWDTSGSVYANIMRIERELLLENFASIRSGSYSARRPEVEGNINYKRDFEALKRIDLAQMGSYRDFLNHLRALTHGELNNAYFIDDQGQKVFVRIHLEPEQHD